MNKKISKIKEIIKEFRNIDGDFWHYGGNELIYEILNSFDGTEWEKLKVELNNFEDYEHSIFARAILSYKNDRMLSKADVYEIFFLQFVLLNDLDDSDCLLQDIMYLENIRKPKLNLLENVKEKIKILRSYEKSINNEEMFLFAENLIDDVIKKHYR